MDAELQEMVEDLREQMRMMGELTPMIAKGTWRMFCALTEEGFTREEAMRITIALSSTSPVSVK